MPVALQRLPEQGYHCLRQPGLRCQLRTIELQNMMNGGADILPDKGVAPAEKLEDHDTGRKQIAAGVQGLPANLLRRHIAGGADDRRFMGHLLFILPESQAEIGNLQAQPLIDQNIFRLDIAMNHLMPVRKPQPGQQLPRQGEFLRFAVSVALEPLAQIISGKIFEGDVEMIFVCAEVQHPDNIGVVQASEDLRFPLKTLAHRRVGKIIKVKGLEHDLAAQPGILRQVNTAVGVFFQIIKKDVFFEPGVGHWLLVVGCWLLVVGC